MRFGVFYELQLPKPWDGDAEYRLVQEAIEQVQLADRIGIEHAWAVEHHFLEEYSHCSASEVFLSALAAKTEQIRLGFGSSSTATTSRRGASRRSPSRPPSRSPT